MFTLKWKNGNSPNREALGQDITELAPDAHGTAYTDWGIFCLDIETRMAYKDGTQQYRVFLYTKEAVSCVQIPLLSIRGHLADAIRATEELLFSKRMVMPASESKNLPVKEIASRATNGTLITVRDSGKGKDLFTARPTALTASKYANVQVEHISIRANTLILHLPSEEV